MGGVASLCLGGLYCQPDMVFAMGMCYVRGCTAGMVGHLRVCRGGLVECKVFGALEGPSTAVYTFCSESWPGVGLQIRWMGQWRVPCGGAGVVGSLCLGWLGCGCLAGIEQVV